MNCPRCGAPVADGKAYCENPACGGLAAGAERKKVVLLNKGAAATLSFDFVKLARWAAVLIAALALAAVYFVRARG